MPSSSWAPRASGAQLKAQAISSHSARPTARSLDDSGFGMIEIVVSIFILAILSLALLPPLIQGMRQSANNAILVSATHLLSAQMDAARQQVPTCAALTNYVASANTDVNDPSGVTLRVSATLDSCPSVYPGTVGLTVTVVRTDTAETLVFAKTLVYLENEN